MFCPQMTCVVANIVELDNIFPALQNANTNPIQCNKENNSGFSQNIDTLQIRYLESLSLIKLHFYGFLPEVCKAHPTSQQLLQTECIFTKRAEYKKVN